MFYSVLYKNKISENVDGLDLTLLDFRILGAPMIQKTGLDLYHDPQLANHHMNAWMELLENASRRFRCSYSGATPMVVFQNSFFFRKLEQLQHEQVVSRWFKTVDVWM
jgi:hypothetical protein